MAVRVLRNLSTAHLAAIGRVITNLSGLDVTAHSAITVGFGTDFKLELLQSLAETALARGPARDGMGNKVPVGEFGPHFANDCDYLARMNVEKPRDRDITHWFGDATRTKIFGYLGQAK
jgi:hypothetical protein